MKTSMRIKKVKRISETEFEIELESRTRTTFKIGKEIKQILEDLAHQKGVTLSDIIHEALKEEIREIYDLGRDIRISINIRLDILRELDELAIKYKIARTYIIHSKIAEYLKKKGILIRSRT